MREYTSSYSAFWVDGGVVVLRCDTIAPSTWAIASNVTANEAGLVDDGVLAVLVVGVILATWALRRAQEALTIFAYRDSADLIELLTVVVVGLDLWVGVCDG
jgi:hypothetical protein